MKDNIKFKDIFKILKILTGSLMSEDYFWEQYNSIRDNKKKYIYGRVREVAKKHNFSFDISHPLFIVDINILAAEEQIDPAVALAIYLNKKSL